MPASDLRRDGSRLASACRVPRCCVCLALLGWAGCDGSGPRHSPAEFAKPDRAPSALTGAASGVRDPGERLIGVASCAGAGCHGLIEAASGGEALSGGAAPWRTAYWKWKDRDPHSAAYDTLYLPRSVRIVENLEPQAVAAAEPYTDFIERTCCGCHAPGCRESRDEPDGSLRPWQRSLGVDCEACHGGARDWVALHTRADWPSRPAEERRELGQQQTRDLVVRAQVCVGCHVGSPGILGKEVDHDLIAAGHPRLNFEFSGYLANLPPHWGVEDDREWGDCSRPDSSPRTRRSNFDYEGWQAGQLVTVDQIVLQLAARARRAGGTRPDETVRWPELAEYDCFSCHHDLSPASDRQREKQPGSGLRWGTWIVSASHAWIPALEPLQEPLQRLRVLLESAIPALDDVHATCQRVHVTIEMALARLPREDGTDRLQEWIVRLAASDLPFRGWMEAAQWSLAVGACGEAHKTAAAGAPESAAALSLRRRLDALDAALAFDRHANATSPSSRPANSDTAFDSPYAFDPADVHYVGLIRGIQSDLRQLAGSAAHIEKGRR